MTARDAVEQYLNELFDRLAGTGAVGRRALVETEDHLAESKAALIASGLDEREASLRAVARFGDARQIARDLRNADRDLAGLARQLFMTGWLLGALGAVAVGLSGLLAAGMRGLWGATFLSGDTNGVTYTASRCADFIGYFPGRTCEAAATLHHAGEVVDSRVALGFLGLLACGAFAVARRTWLSGPRWRVAPDAATLLGTTLFGLAAVALGGQSLLQLLFQGTTGVGANLSGGMVAGVFALATAVVGLRHRMRVN